MLPVAMVMEDVEIIVAFMIEIMSFMIEMVSFMIDGGLRGVFERILNRLRPGFGLSMEGWRWRRRRRGVGRRMRYRRSDGAERHGRL